MIKQRQLSSNKSSNTMDLSFSGAGFMGCYYFGVIDCWKKYIPRERVNRAAGSSAGSLIAAYYLCDVPLHPALGEIVRLLEEIRSRPLGVFDRSHQIVDILPRVLDKVLPEDAHKRVSGKLHVCMTRMKDMKKVIVSEFETRKDLIDALNCSSFIPVWSGNHVSTYKGVKHIDGGFADNLPVFDEHTIRICCFSGPTDISPYDRAKMELFSVDAVNMPLYINFGNCRRLRKALFPPPASFVSDLLERGFQDAKDFILTNDLIQCDTCYRKGSGQQVRERLKFAQISPAVTPRASPAVSRMGSFRKQQVGGQQQQQEHHNHLLTVPGQLDMRSSSLSDLLHEKLRSNSANSYESAIGSYTEDSPVAGQSSCTAPAIVVEQVVVVDTQSPPVEQSSAKRSRKHSVATDSSDSSSDLGLGDETSSGEDATELASRSPVHSPRQVVNRRRSSLFQQQQQQQQLVVADKFTLVPNPLPSCPPSPNLNRHCVECIRLRSEARRDLISDDVREEVERYRTPGQVKGLGKSGLKGKLSSPMRWLRQIGVKNSYSFDAENSSKSSEVLFTL